MQAGYSKLDFTTTVACTKQGNRHQRMFAHLDLGLSAGAPTASCRNRSLFAA
jgi:hypothetical protein